MVKNLQYFFSDGYNRLTVGEAKECRRKLTDELCSGNASRFSTLLNRGIKNIPKPRYDAVTEIFGEYGICEEDVWRVVELENGN